MFVLLCFSPPEKKITTKKTSAHREKTVKEWFISIRYILETYLDALCREVSWNAEGGSKKIGHFHGSCFTPKVTQFRIDFVIVLSTDSINNCIREWIRRELMLMSFLEVASSS